LKPHLQVFFILIYDHYTNDQTSSLLRQMCYFSQLDFHQIFFHNVNELVMKISNRS